MLRWFPNFTTALWGRFGSPARFDLILCTERDRVHCDEGVVADEINAIGFAKVGGEAVADRETDAVPKTEIVISW